MTRGTCSARRPRWRGTTDPRSVSPDRGGPGMHYLVIDTRFGTPIYAFLELDPRGDGSCTLAVREVTLEFLPAAGGAAAGRARLGRRPAIGRDPYQLDQFREFTSDGAVARG